MAEDKLPWMKFYPADFMGSGKVQMMSPAERGIYISLLCHEWQEGHLPDDPSRLARVAGATPREMEGAWPSVRPCFSVDDDGRLYHERLESEREDAVERMERRRKMSEAGRKGAAKRWADGDGNSPPTDEGSDDGSTTRVSDASDAQTFSSTDVQDVQKDRSDAIASGEDADVENPQGPLCEAIRQNGWTNGAPSDWDMGRAVNLATQLIGKGYSWEDLEGAVHGLRMMAERKHPDVRDWIGPGDSFSLRTFNRAEEKGAKLIQTAAAYYRKHSGPSPPDKRRGRSGPVRVSEVTATGP